MTEHELRADGVTLGYGGADVIRDLDLLVSPGEFTVIVGANACGKSTLLRGLARLLRPRGGVVILDGRSIQERKSVDVARVLGLLPQTSVAPDGITVGDLVGRGRYPHQGWFRQWSGADDEAVSVALESTGTADLVRARVDELSGGQRQRVWIARALAQETDVLLLDEPTAHLDLAHQVEIMDLLADLNARGRTIVAVLHDLNQAARYADRLVAMRGGRVVAAGTSEEVVTEALVEAVFGLAVQVMDDPVTGTPLVVPAVSRLVAPTG
jgi:iron complex transport system ATP-binding protein